MNLAIMSRHDDMQIVEEKLVKSTGEVLVRRYSKGRLLGKGGFAKVYEAINIETKIMYALKMMEKASISKARQRQKFMAEVKIHKVLHHTNIVKFEGYFEDSDFVYIILEICPNQTLNDLMKRRKRITELETQCYLAQVLSSLRYLHSHRVIHRDIKLGNIFLSEKMEVKMGDFGLAAKLEFEGEKKRTICGTPNYIAPEILDGKNGHSYEVDIWSFGVLMYTLLIGKPPFETNDVKTTYRRIKMNAYSFPDHVTLTPEAKDLIEKILVTDPVLRPTISDIEEHPFFLKNQFPKFLPTSTLAIPPSSTYMRQFDKPTGLSCGRGRDSSTKPRSMSNNKEDLKPPSRGEGRAMSGERNDGSGSRMKKQATISVYSPTVGGPRIWIKKWVDYSNKYGLAFVFSNGCAGMYFNDASKISCTNDGQLFQYLSKGLNPGEDILNEYTFDEYPQELMKKVKLLQHFKKHLKNDEIIHESISPLPYIKKWLVTSHAVIFRLSIKIVQVYFTDKSELMLCSDTKYVVYISKNGEITSTPLINALDSGNREMSKRLRYTKEIITTMIPNTGKLNTPR